MCPILLPLFGSWNHLLPILRTQYNKKVSDLAWYTSWKLVSQSQCIISKLVSLLWLQQALPLFYHAGGIYMICDTINGSHGHMSLLNLLTVKVGPLIWCIVICESCRWIKHSVSPWILMLLEAPWLGKTNPYLAYMSVPIRTNVWPLQDGRRPI